MGVLGRGDGDRFRIDPAGLQGRETGSTELLLADVGGRAVLMNDRGDGGGSRYRWEAMVVGKTRKPSWRGQIYANDKRAC